MTCNALFWGNCIDIIRIVPLKWMQILYIIHFDVKNHVFCQSPRLHSTSLRLVHGGWDTVWRLYLFSAELFNPLRVAYKFVMDQINGRSSGLHWIWAGYLHCPLWWTGRLLKTIITWSQSKQSDIRLGFIWRFGSHATLTFSFPFLTLVGAMWF